MKKGKLSKDDIELMLSLFQQGWKQNHLSRKFEIDHTTVYYYIKKYRVVRNGEVFRLPPIEIRHTYTRINAAPQWEEPNIPHSYAEYLEQARRRDAQKKAQLSQFMDVDKRSPSQV